MLGNADKHAPVLSILCCARRIHVLDAGCEAPRQGLGTAFGSVPTVSGVSAFGAKHHGGVEFFTRLPTVFGIPAGAPHPPLPPSSS